MHGICPGCWLKLLKCCYTSTETVGLLGTGAQDVHLDLHTALSAVGKCTFGFVVEGKKTLTGIHTAARLTSLIIILFLYGRLRAIFKLKNQ